MGLDNCLRDVEAEAETAIVAAGDVARAVEALEQSRDLVARNSDAAIDHRCQHDAVGDLRSNDDLARVG